MNKKRLLFVDDEQSILTLLERMFTPMREQWDIVLTDTGEKALAIMQENPVDVLISDLNMPGMDGARLMDQVADSFPQTVRCIFSGYPSREGALDLAKTTHQFLLKPDDLLGIRNFIKRAAALREILPDDRIARVTTQVKTLPSLPALYTQLISEIQSEEVSMQRIGDIIEQDPAMTAKVLQLVNSAFFGLRERVNSAGQAAGLLGLEILKSLVLMAHIFSQYEQVDVKDFSIRALWRHSAAVALYARDIAACEKYDDDTSDACFVSGLLHDIGKLVLAVNLPAEYEAVMHKVHTEKCCLVDTEKEMLGASHAEVGAYLFGLWGFSDAVVEACAYHHFPSDCLSCDVELLTCVHVANMFDHDAQHINLGEKLDIGYLKNQGKEAKLSEWKQVAGLEV